MSRTELSHDEVKMLASLTRDKFRVGGLGHMDGTGADLEACRRLRRLGLAEWDMAGAYTVTTAGREWLLAHAMKAGRS